MLLNYHIGRLVLNSLCVGDLVRLVLSGARFGGFQSAKRALHIHQIVTSCSFKFYNLITYVLKIFLFGRFCGSFQFIPQSPVVPPAFFIVDILPFPSLTHFTNHFLCNPWFFLLSSQLYQPNH